MLHLEFLHPNGEDSDSLEFHHHGLRYPDMQVILSTIGSLGSLTKPSVVCKIGPFNTLGKKNQGAVVYDWSYSLS